MANRLKFFAAFCGKTFVFHPAVNHFRRAQGFAHFSMRPHEAALGDTMRKLMLTTALATATAIFAACETKPETPNKPPASPVPAASPVTAASPVASPSPTGSPAKPTGSPIQKIDNTNMKKDTAPSPVSTPK
jgi:hypothetical protein